MHQIAIRIIPTLLLGTTALFLWTTALSGGDNYAAAVRPQAESSAVEIPILSEADALLSYTVEQAGQLAVCLAEAGTPFFTDISAVSTAELEEAAFWWAMEAGEMPVSSGEEVRISLEQLSQWIEQLFHCQLEPEDCALAVYDEEQEFFMLQPSAILPVYYPVIESVEENGERLQLTVSLGSVSGWEGDIDGNIYRSEQLAAAVLLIEKNGISWLSH